jgi:uncharacterized protein (DUF305 family)
MTMSSRSIRGRHLTALLLTLLAAFAFAACGGDDGEQSGAGGDVEAVEEAFLTGMVHHHGTAIQMAEIAQERGESEFVTGLADDIVSTQEQEISKMEAIYDRLIGGELEPDPAAHDGLGLSAEEAGMTHGPETNEMLEMAMPFDRAFVDEMTPHHTGAVKMANVVLESTEDQELRDLAEGIVATQEREIEAMNAFRTEEYGAPVPEPQGGGGGGHGGGHSG